MPNTDVSICNSALISIGADRITSLIDGTEAAILCNEIFNSERDALLEEHRWNFAIKRVALALEDVTPAHGYYYSYALPADYRAVIDLGDNSGPYVIEGQSLLTSDTEVNLQYVARVIQPALWPDTFCRALAGRIAKKLAPKMEASSTTTERLLMEADRSLLTAKTVDAVNSGKPTPKRPSAFINARR